MCSVPSNFRTLAYFMVLKFLSKTLLFGVELGKVQETLMAFMLKIFTTKKVNSSSKHMIVISIHRLYIFHCIWVFVLHFIFYLSSASAVCCATQQSGWDIWQGSNPELLC